MNITCSNKTLFTKPGGGPDVASGPWFAGSCSRTLFVRFLCAPNHCQVNPWFHIILAHKCFNGCLQKTKILLEYYHNSITILKLFLNVRYIVIFKFSQHNFCLFLTWVRSNKETWPRFTRLFTSAQVHLPGHSPHFLFKKAGLKSFPCLDFADCISRCHLACSLSPIVPINRWLRLGAGALLC